jgi:hypothetical protein
MGDKEVNLTRQVVACLHCDNKSRMPIVAEFDDVARDAQGYEAGTYWELLRCDACEKVSLRSVDWHEFMEEVEWTLLYPQAAVATVDGLPANISRAWASAQRVKRVDANAYAVLVRRVLELVCADNAATGRDLAAKLSDLASKGKIPGPLAAIAHNARNFGNIGAHASLGDLRQSEARLLDELCVAVLEHVYTAPLLVTKAQAALERLGKH